MAISLKGVCLFKLVFLSVVGSTWVAASPMEEAARCDRAAEQAARAALIPVNILQAAARLESGRTLDGVRHPWPWSFRLGQDSRSFAGELAMRQHVFRMVKSGATHFSVGCFQLTFQLGPSAGASLDDLLDPRFSADHAAQILASLHDETGDWQSALAAFHSGTSDHARRTLSRHWIISKNRDFLPGTEVAALAARRGAPASLARSFDGWAR